MKKILSLCLAFLFIFSNICMASSENLLLVIEESSETAYLENDQGYLDKSIVDYDSEAGEITIELSLANKSTTSTAYEDTEIFLVVDNSPSMDFELSSRTNEKRNCS